MHRLFEPDEFKYLIENLKSRFRKRTNVKSDKYAENMGIRHQKYVEFNNHYFKFFPSVHNWRILKKMCEECKAIVVGSDQLWRPSNIAGGFFTLEFVPDHVNKVSLSTSFGVSTLPSFQHRKAAKFLNRMDSISVREESGKKLIKELTGRDILVVCDPTMLLSAEEWMQIQERKPLINEKYILCYFMGDNPTHRDFVKKLKEKTNYKIIGLLHGATYIPSDDKFPDEAPYDIGPAEFINLVRNAEFMCTDSFHGTVFSILNRTKFFSFRRYEDSSKFSTNDRLHTLLDWTGLSHRMIYGNEDINDLLNDLINYDEVLPKVLAKRNEAIDYLKNALEIGDDNA